MFSVVLSLLVLVSSIVGMCIFIPSSNIVAKFIFFMSAFSFDPPAFSIASAILAPVSSSTIPSLLTAPVICTTIFSSSFSSIFSVFVISKF